ncbi:MAG: M23 family metallopeptidase [Thermoleophilaceae bacterium]
MLLVKDISRVGALALASLSGGFAVLPGAAASAASTDIAPFAPLVPLDDVAARAALDGPRSVAVEDAPAGLAVVPGRVPEQVERFAARVIDPRAPARFPVDGQFNFGQEGARFGAGRSGHVHAGQDVFGRTGTPLVAVADGVVLERGTDGGRGNYIAIYDPVVERTYVYLHLERPARVGEGETVRAGEPVGAVGCTGSCFGDHLHFEIRQGRDIAGRAADPLPDLERWAASNGADAGLPPGAH